MNLIDDIFIISFLNDEKRINNIKEMQKKFDKEFKIITPVKHEKPHGSLFETNLKIWLENAGKNIIIFEDDFFTHFSKQELNDWFACLNRDIKFFDLILLGGDVYEYEKLADKNFIKVKSFVDTHSIYYSKNFTKSVGFHIKNEYETIKDLYLKDEKFDIHLSRYLKENKKEVFAFNPRLFAQKNYISTISSSKTEKVINHKYDSDFLIKKPFDNGMIKLKNLYYDGDYFKVEYFLNSDADKHFDAKIFLVDLYSGVRYIKNQMKITKNLQYFTGGNTWLRRPTHLYFEIYCDDVLVLRKFLIKDI